MQNRRKLKLDLRVAGIGVLAGYNAISFIFSDFSISAAFGAFALFAYAGLCILQTLVQGYFKRKRWDLTDGLLLLIAAVVLVGIVRARSFDHTAIYYGMIMGAAFLVYWSTEEVGRTALTAGKWILIGSALLSAVLNVFQLFFPQVIKSCVYPLLSPTSLEYNLRLAREGYGFALSEDIAYGTALMAFGIGLLSIQMTKKNWKLHSALLLVLLVGFISIQRRGELAALLAALPVIQLFRALHNRKLRDTAERLKRKTALLLAALQILCFAVSYALVAAVSSSSRFEETVQFITGDWTPPEEEDIYSLTPDDLGIENNSTFYALNEITTGRLVLWVIAWRGFLEKPVFGHGWRTYAEVYAQTAGEKRNMIVVNAHNIYLQLLYEVGIVGCLLFVGALVLLAWMGFRKMRACTDGARFLNGLFGLYIFLFILIDGIYDNPIFSGYFVIALVIACMLLFRRGASNESDASHESATPDAAGEGAL